MKFLLVLLISISSYASITEEQFHSIPKDVVEAIQEEIQSSPISIDINFDWESDTLNAGANRDGNKAVLNLYGGYARIEPMTAGSFASTICHELGHIIGGQPKVMPTHKYSSEGQSDYFASNICLKKYLRTRLKKVQISSFHEKLCNDSFSKESEISLCRNLMAISIDKLNVENVLTPSQAYFETNKLDKSKVNITIFNDYPSVSCRYTTFIHGALNRERPACWFHPETPLENTNYILDYLYAEAMFIGVAFDIREDILGCSYRVKDISYFREGALGAVWSEDLEESRVYSFNKCRVNEGETTSGTITEYNGGLYLHVNHVDK